MRIEALGILQKEAELQDIVQLVGYDALPESEKGTMDVAKMIREDYLQQSAYDDVDTFLWAKDGMIRPEGHDEDTRRKQMEKTSAWIFSYFASALDRKVRDRKERHRLQCELALQEFEAWLRLNSFQPTLPTPSAV